MADKKIQLEEAGCFWAYQLPKKVVVTSMSSGRTSRLLISRMKDDGFSRRTATQLVPQVLRAFQASFEDSEQGYQTVKLGGQKFYVCISSTGVIELPNLNNGKCGRTSDSSLIPGFESGKNYDLL